MAGKITKKYVYLCTLKNYFYGEIEKSVFL